MTSRLPVDFVSTHAYADENFEHTFTKAELPPMDDRVCAVVKGGTCADCSFSDAKAAVVYYRVEM